VSEPAATSYAANFALFGGLALPAGSVGTSSYSAGRYPRYKLMNIPDGTSNTIAFACSYAGRAGSAAPASLDAQLWAIPYGYSSSTATPAPSLTLVTTADSPNGEKCAIFGTVTGTTNPIPLFNIDQTNATNRTAVYACHGTTCMVGVMDGSVKLINTGITQTTWDYATRPDDRLPLGSNW